MELGQALRQARAEAWFGAKQFLDTLENFSVGERSYFFHRLQASGIALDELAHRVDAGIPQRIGRPNRHVDCVDADSQRLLVWNVWQLFEHVVDLLGRAIDHDSLAEALERLAQLVVLGAQVCEF